MKSSDLAQASDIALVELTRRGVADAYAELWKRHAPAVIAAARCFTGFDPDDVAQETFLRVLQRIQAGHGPNTAFRAYALMTARNVATNMSRNRSSDEITGSDESVFELYASELPDTAEKVLGSAFVHQVFSTLPTRWQEVLWYRGVEDLPVREFSTYLGMTENATSALLKRAREGFKQAWIAANLEPEAGLPADCQWVVEKLPQITRGKSNPVTRKKLAAHFESCSRCTTLAEESNHIDSRLALVLLPALIGGPAATGYSAWLQLGASAPASAAVFNASAAMASNAAGLEEAKLRLVGSGMTKSMILPVGAISLGVLATSIALSLSMHAEPEAPPVVEPFSQKSSTESLVEKAETEKTSQVGAAQEQSKPNSTDDGGVNGAATGAQTSADPNSAAAISDGNAESNPNGATDGVDQQEAPAGLSAVPLDGLETGVYPRLVGFGAPNGSIMLHVTNELGQSYEQRVTADAQGRWAFTLTELLGQLTVTGQQSYSFQGKDFSDDEVVIGSYAVGNGLGIEVEAKGAEETTIRVTGLAAPTKNQVVNIESTGHGTLAARHPLTGPGEVTLTVPFPRSSLGDLRYWQGDTSEGPRRVWWRALAD